MADPFSAAVDEVFNSSIGVAATYTLPGGSPLDSVTVRVIASAPDDTFSGFGRERVSATTNIEVRVSEVGTAEIGGEFVVDGVTYRIGAAPVRDARRLKWICEAPAV